MNHSGATGMPRGSGLRRAHWLALGAIVLCLALLGGVLLYLSPVLALLDNHESSRKTATAPTPAWPPPPFDSKQRINILLLGSDNDQKFQQNALLSQTMIVVSIDPPARRLRRAGAFGARRKP